VKTYPDYEIQSTEVRGNKCTVTVWAKSTCGPTITAYATVLAKQGESLQALEDAARTMAARNLSHEHDAHIATCIKQGKHRGHPG